MYDLYTVCAPTAGPTVGLSVGLSVLSVSLSSTRASKAKQFKCFTKTRHRSCSWTQAHPTYAQQCRAIQTRKAFTLKDSALPSDSSSSE